MGESVETTYYLYHGTDLASANEITNSGFEFSRREDNWLGDGIYFYGTLKEAKIWAERVIKKRRKEYAPYYVVFKVKIKVFPDDVFDTRRENDYTKLCDFVSEIQETLDGYSIVSTDRRETKLAKLKTVLFRLFEIEYSYKMYIAVFDKHLNNDKIFSIRELGFSGDKEVQYCVKDKSIIVEEYFDIYKLQEEL